MQMFQMWKQQLMAHITCNLYMEFLPKKDKFNIITTLLPDLTAIS